MDKIKRFYRILVDFICTLMDDNVGVYAAQASFFIIISAVPFIMLLLNLVNIFFPVDTLYLDTLILYSPHSVQETLLKITDELLDKSSSVSVISITAVSSIWLSSRGIMALFQGLNTVYHADIRNYFYCRVMSIFYTLIFIVVLLLTIAVFTFGNTIHMFLIEFAPFLSTVSAAILEARTFIFLILLTLLFALFYRFLPQCKPHLKFIHQIPGAMGAAIGWMGFSYIYSIYIENFSNYSYVYGSLTAIVFLMLWLYFCMNIFLFGAQLNKMLKTGYFKTLFKKHS